MDTVMLGVLVMAQAVLMTSGAVRLSGGLNDREGRLEVQYRSTWGTVCGITWTQEDSRVVCTQLGFTGEARFFFLPSPYGPGSGRIWLESVNCTGRERTLEDCPHSPWGTLVTSCNHYDDVGIVCLGNRIGRPPVVTRPQPRPAPPAACTNESIRLSGGVTSREGRVELTHRGRWGTVCDDAWDARAAAVVCHMLGYEPGSASRALTSPVPFSRGRTERIWLDDVICGLGGEACLSQCGSLGWGNHDCTHYEDAGVICLGELVLDPPTPPTTPPPLTTTTTTPMTTTSTPSTATSTTPSITTSTTTLRTTTTISTTIKPPTTPPTTITITTPSTSTTTSPTTTTTTTVSVPTSPRRRRLRSTTLSQILRSTPEDIILPSTSRSSASETSNRTPPALPSSTTTPYFRILTTPATSSSFMSSTSIRTVTIPTTLRRLPSPTTESTTSTSTTRTNQPTTTTSRIVDLSSTTTRFETFFSTTTYTKFSDGLDGEVPMGGVAAGVVLAGIVMGAILYGILIIRRQ